MSSKKTPEGEAMTAGPTAEQVMTPYDLAARAAGAITAVERARLRVECIKAAMITRTAAMPIRSLVTNAREIEQYVLDPACHLPEPEAAEGDTEET